MLSKELRINISIKLKMTDGQFSFIVKTNTIVNNELYDVRFILIVRDPSDRNR